MKPYSKCLNSDLKFMLIWILSKAISSKSYQVKSLVRVHNYVCIGIYFREKKIMAFNRKSSQIVFACIGILVSCYAYYVETSKEVDTSYVALCDINPSVSCSKVFTSK